MRDNIAISVPFSSVFPITNTVLNADKSTTEIAKDVANQFVSKLSSKPPKNGQRGVVNDLVITAIGYLFDAVYCDWNKIRFCENCTYEWASNFWAQIYSYNAVMLHYDNCEKQIVQIIHTSKTTHIWLADGAVFHFVYDTTKQPVPLNETEKSFSQGRGFHIEEMEAA